MKVKEFFKQARLYVNVHPFHIVMTVAMITMFVMHISHYMMTGTMYNWVAKNSNDIATSNIKNMLNRNSDRKEFLDVVELKGSECAKNLAAVKEETNSKIDILNSSIDPENKKRKLIEKVRIAISENTNTKLEIRELNNISIAVVDYSYHYNLSIAKVLAQIRQESNFVITARSPANAQGLMQVIPETWEYVSLKEFERKNASPDNVYHNIKAGCFYMSEQLFKFNNFDDALRAYNWGPDKVRKLRAGEIDEKHIPQETIEYVVSINKWIKVFERYGLE